MDELADPGMALQLGVGYRYDPNLMFGGYVEGSIYRADEGGFSDGRNFGAAAGVQVQYHFLPFERFDPWIGAGMGWRGYWMVDDDAGTSTLQGADLLRAQFGVDCHITPKFNLSPTVGATFTTFVGRHGLQSDHRPAPGELHFLRHDGPLRHRRNQRREHRCRESVIARGATTARLRCG
jgi:hypothetical protein